MSSEELQVSWDRKTSSFVSHLNGFPFSDGENSNIRSQSWLIRTRHLLNDDKALETVCLVVNFMFRSEERTLEMSLRNVYSNPYFNFSVVLAICDQKRR